VYPKKVGARKKMDYISSPEFAAIFDRTSDKVNFQGRFSSDAIAEKLNNVKKKCLEMRQVAKSSKVRNRLKRTAMLYQNLIDYGFPERTIREARAKPNGIIAMTLKCGKADAKARILARKKTQIRVRGRPQFRPYPR
jgi:hypothetical protein